MAAPQTRKGKMKIFKTKAPVSIHSGKLRLTEKQALARASMVTKERAGLYRVIKPMEFKAGEKFGYDGELPKSLAALVEEVNINMPDPDSDPDSDPATTPKEIRAAALKDMEYKDLCALAAEMDIKTFGVKRVEVEASILDAEFPE